mgnify:CR=1 FL=1
MPTLLPALPVEACTKVELAVLATLQSVEKGLQKTWHQESTILGLLEQYAHVENWMGPQAGYFNLRTDRTSVFTSVGCKDPFPLPDRRNGEQVGVTWKLYVDGIDSCVLDEMNNRGPTVVFNELVEETNAFREDMRAMLNHVLIYGDGTDAPKHVDTADAMFANSFNGPGMSTVLKRGSGPGLLSILGDDTIRPEYLTLSGADDDCEFWRAGIYDADVLSQLDPDDPAYWDGHLDFAKLIEWTHLRKTQNSKYVAITDQITFLKIKLSVIRRLGQPLDGSPSPLNGGSYDPFPDVTSISFGGITFVEDLMWPANSIGVFDFNEIWFKPVPELWMKNTGWQAAFNNPLQKYLWEMWMFAVYTKRRNAHILICNPTITDYCQPVSICNTDALAAAISG